MRDWIRVEGERPTAHRYAARIYEDMGAYASAADEAQKAADRAPRRRSAWERLGRLRLRTGDRLAARAALERPCFEPSVEALLDLALVHHLMGDVGAEVSACEQATALAPEVPAAWSATPTRSRAPTGSPTLAACERALSLGPDPEVEDLRERVRDAQPRQLSSSAA